MVPWTHVREPPLWGKCLTDLTSEFTHFNLVIRLSKVQQSALRFSLHFWRVLPFLPSFWTQGIAFLMSDAVPNFRNLLFAAAFSDRASWLMLEQATGMSFSCRCGLFGFWWGETCCASNSLELVQLFYANWGKNWPRAWNGITHDF